VSNSLANSEWKAFINKLETAEEEFVQGRPAAFCFYGLIPMTSLFAVALVASNVNGIT
jgi:hypothetical protein